MYEILHKFNLIKKYAKEFVWFNMCELPGQFIKCIDYYIKTKRNAKYIWYGNSLKPGNKNAFDDHYGLYKNNKDRWLFGKDGTGDITNIENICDFKKKINKNIDLITSDAGIEVEDNDAESFQK